MPAAGTGFSEAEGQVDILSTVAGERGVVIVPDVVDVITEIDTRSAGDGRAAGSGTEGETIWLEGAIRALAVDVGNVIPNEAVHLATIGVLELSDGVLENVLEGKLDGNTTDSGFAIGFAVGLSRSQGGGRRRILLGVNGPEVDGLLASVEDVSLSGGNSAEEDKADGKVLGEHGDDC